MSIVACPTIRTCSSLSNTRFRKISRHSRDLADNSIKNVVEVCNKHSKIMSIEQSTRYLFLRHLNFSIVDGGDNVRRMLSIDGAAHRTTRNRQASHLLAGSQHLLHGSSQLVGIGTLTEDLGHLDHLIESNVSVVLHYTSASTHPCSYRSSPSYDHEEAH